MNNCKPDMIVARPLYSECGALLLSKGHLLTDRHIHALKQRGFPGLYIFDQFSEGINPEEIVLDDDMRRIALNGMKEIFDKGANISQAKNQELCKIVSRIVYDIVDHVFKVNPAVLSVPLMKSFDEHVYQHSVEVGILAIMIGKNMNMPKNEVFNLGMAAFFHDIGKIFVPKTILSKKGKFTREEFNVMKIHPEWGFDFAKEVLGLPPVINQAVLHHHERFDGTGYPYKLKCKQIPLFARIISVADVFDALGSSRVYKKAQLTTEGYGYIMAGAGRQFDPNIVDIFSKTVAPFPTGLTVELSSGLHAVVVRNNPNFMTRPLVCAFNPNNLKEREHINLASDADALGIKIVGIV
ncbi:MAG: HD-GYP domain-containing protein [Defluviitaleaceae bacterium]|nr:HD-GYP domain-containing protein [Defluviitaleaceae bacterium]